MVFEALQPAAEADITAAKEAKLSSPAADPGNDVEQQSELGPVADVEHDAFVALGMSDIVVINEAKMSSFVCGFSLNAGGADVFRTLDDVVALLAQPEEGESEQHEVGLTAGI